MQNSVWKYLENTVKNFPDNIAVEDKNSNITFRELYESAKKIGSVISAKYNLFKQPILVYLPKSVNSIKTFMSIVYSGNIYTPKDVEFPFAKVKSVMDTLEPRIILSDDKYKEKLIK